MKTSTSIALGIGLCLAVTPCAHAKRNKSNAAPPAKQTNTEKNKPAAEQAPATASPTSTSPLAPYACPFRDYLNQSLLSLKLEWQPRDNQYLVGAKLNGKPAKFLVDSGASASLISTAAAKRIGLPLKESGLHTGGIAGGSKSFLTEFQELQVGPHIKIENQQLSAVDFKDNVDGILGGDMLGSAKAIIDHQRHLMMYAADPSICSTFPAKAKEMGMKTIPLTREGSHVFLQATVNQKPLRLLLDTGAQQSVFDAKVVEALGIKAIDSDKKAVGVSNTSTSIKLANIPSITINDVTCSNLPVAVMSLDHVQNAGGQRYDGIIGAEFLYASEGIIDLANLCLYTTYSNVSLQNFSKTGGQLFSSEAELRKAIDKAPWVGSVDITKMQTGLDVAYTDEKGGKWRIAEITAKVTDVLKGEKIPENTLITVNFLIPDRPDTLEWSTGIFGRNPQKILFCNPKETGDNVEYYYDAVFSDGELPRAEIDKVCE